jgi:ABC-type dipeptide/oligopeptide/nickel transport system permease subunit
VVLLLLLLLRRVFTMRAAPAVPPAVAPVAVAPPVVVVSALLLLAALAALGVGVPAARPLTAECDPVTGWSLGRCICRGRAGGRGLAVVRRAWRWALFVALLVAH